MTLPELTLRSLPAAPPALLAPKPPVLLASNRTLPPSNRHLPSQRRSPAFKNQKHPPQKADAARALTALRSGETIGKFILVHERD